VVVDELAGVVDELAGVVDEVAGVVDEELDEPMIDGIVVVVVVVGLVTVEP